MTKKIILYFSITVILLIIAQCTPTKKYPEELDALVPGASVIFKGKILLLHTATTDEQDVTNAGVVVVTDVIDAPESFPDISGRQVTVRFADIKKVSVNEEREFFTDPYWIGESLGLREIGSIGKEDKLYENKEISAYINQAREKQQNETLEKMLKESKLVITGKVIKVDEIKGEKIVGSEHDPEWKEAEIQINETLKGKVESKTVKVLFASSNDVMFFQAPKFNVGDAGVFIIQQTYPQTAELLKNENMIVNPSGFISGEEKTQHIKSLINNLTK